MLADTLQELECRVEGGTSAMSNATRGSCWRELLDRSISISKANKRMTHSIPYPVLSWFKPSDHNWISQTFVIGSGFPNVLSVEEPRTEIYAHSSARQE